MGDEIEFQMKILNKRISRKSLTDLHTHLMGMGSADFWVSTIMVDYLSAIDKPVYYPLEHILTASGINFKADDNWSKEIAFSILEARMFDGQPSGSLLDNSELKKAEDLESLKSIPEGEVRCISNSKLVSMLKQDSGPLRALIRNWFEFLDSSGIAPGHTDILDTCRFHVRNC